MATTNTIFILTPNNGSPTATLSAAKGTITDASTPAAIIDVLLFDTSTAEFYDWFFTVPSQYSGQGFTISWKGGTDNTSTGTFELEIRMVVLADAVILTGDLGLDSATAVAIVDTPPTTPINKMNQSVTGTLSHANAGSPVKGDLVGIRVKRDIDNDTNTGDLQLQEVLILET